MWSEFALPQAIASFHASCPGIELELVTATRTEGLRPFASGESDLHCGGIDTGDLLPSSLRRERFLDMIAGIVAWRDHPLLSRNVRSDDLARCPWIEFDAPARTVPGDGRPSLRALLEQLHETIHTRVTTIIRAGTAGTFFMTRGPYLAWLSITFLERLPGLFRSHPVRTAFAMWRD